MPNLSREIILVSIFTATVVSQCFSCAGAGIPSSQPAAGDAAMMMSWRFSRLGGGTIMAGEFPARLTIVTFFTTWAPPCIMQIEELKKFYEEKRDGGLYVIGVVMDTEKELTAEPFRKMFKIKFPLALADDRIFRGESPFGRVSTVPTTFIFGPDREPLAAFIGTVPGSQLKKIVDRYIR